MEKPVLNYWDYVKAAFGWHVRVPGLGGIALNKWLMAGFAILGVGHPGFWMLGLAFEAAYLLYLPGSVRFQKLVQGTQLIQTEEEWTDKEQNLVSQLDKDAQVRYRLLSERCWRLVNSGDRAPALADIEELKAGDLNHLLWIFLNLLVSRKKIHETLDKTIQEALDEEVRGIQKRIETEKPDSPVYRSLKGILEIQQKRLENQTKAAESLKVIDTELYRIEKQISLLQEELAVSKDPELLSSRLDAVTKSLQGTTDWMAENSQFLSTLEEIPGAPTIKGGPPPIPEPTPVKKKSGGGKIAQ